MQQVATLGIDAAKNIFHGVVFFLAAITVGLFSRVLGADNPSFRPVMGKSCSLNFSQFVAGRSGPGT